tara:strand:+ start:13288 stop:13677 length:390 start_codon:yes stop_codon:yes gene_type:complete
MDAYQVLMEKLDQMVDNFEKEVTTSTVSDFIPSGSGNKYKGKRNYADGTAINEKLPKSYRQSSDPNKHCGNCGFYKAKNRLCQHWSANVRKDYICRSWRSNRGKNPVTREPRRSDSTQTAVTDSTGETS